MNRCIHIEKLKRPRATNKSANNKHILHIMKTKKCRNIYKIIYVWTSKLFNNNRK